MRVPVLGFKHTHNTTCAFGWRSSAALALLSRCSPPIEHSRSSRCRQMSWEEMNDTTRRPSLGRTNPKAQGSRQGPVRFSAVAVCSDQAVCARGLSLESAVGPVTSAEACQAFGRTLLARASPQLHTCRLARLLLAHTKRLVERRERRFRL